MLGIEARDEEEATEEEEEEEEEMDEDDEEAFDLEEDQAERTPSAPSDAESRKVVERRSFAEKSARPRRGRGTRG